MLEGPQSGERPVSLPIGSAMLSLAQRLMAEDILQGQTEGQLVYQPSHAPSCMH